MKQALMTKPGVIEFMDAPHPGSPKPNEVLLKIKRIGVCGSDIHVFHGEHPATPYPVVQGHEYSAIVEEVGSKVSGVKPGMKATARPQLVCGECGPCKNGQYNACQHLKVQGFQAPGVAQEYFMVPEDRLVVLPDTFTLEQGAMIEPAAVGAHSTGRTSGIKGKNVVVSGAGTIGKHIAVGIPGVGYAVNVGQAVGNVVGVGCDNIQSGIGHAGLGNRGNLGKIWVVRVGGGSFLVCFGCLRFGQIVAAGVVRVFCNISACVGGGIDHFHEALGLGG